MCQIPGTTNQRKRDTSNEVRKGTFLKRSDTNTSTHCAFRQSGLTSELLVRTRAEPHAQLHCHAKTRIRLGTSVTRAQSPRWHREPHTRRRLRGQIRAPAARHLVVCETVPRSHAEADRRIAKSPERERDRFTFISGGDTFRSMKAANWEFTNRAPVIRELEAKLCPLFISRGRIALRGV